MTRKWKLREKVVVIIKISVLTKEMKSNWKLREKVVVILIIIIKIKIRNDKQSSSLTEFYSTKTEFYSTFYSVTVGYPDRVS
jgi:surface polysaccharide O-acyltransferase-like enzyme